MKDIKKKVHKETFNLTKEYGCMETDEEYSKRVGFSVLMDYEEICEALVGDDAMKTHTHQDILAYINQLKNTEEEFKYQNNIA
jgi:hypothetical protein